MSNRELIVAAKNILKYVVIRHREFTDEELDEIYEALCTEAVATYNIKRMREEMGEVI